VLRTELLNKIKNADENEFDDTLGKKLLIDAGCNDAEAAVIRDGLCAKADYFSLTVARAADGESSGVSAVCSSNGSLMIAPVPPAGDDDGAGIEFRATGPERFRREASEILSAAGFPREGGDLT
jgi:hypothetical protein